jgi:hypothetical protein
MLSSKLKKRSSQPSHVPWKAERYYTKQEPHVQGIQRPVFIFFWKKKLTLMSKLSDKIFLSKLIQVEDVVFCSVVNGQRSRSEPDKVGLEEQTEGGSVGAAQGVLSVPGGWESCMKRFSSVLLFGLLAIRVINIKQLIWSYLTKQILGSPLASASELHKNSLIFTVWIVEDQYLNLEPLWKTKTHFALFRKEFYYKYCMPSLFKG